MSLTHVEYRLPELSNANYQAVEDALGVLAGVQTPGMDVPAKRLRVSFVSESVSEPQIRAALEAAGFRPEIVA